MREEVSAGGVVVFCNTILLLKKYNGDWVLPKGKIEKKEEKYMAALREVHEEGNVKAEIVKYIDKIDYSFKNFWEDDEIIHKTVYWYLMTSKSKDCSPLKEEGFVVARFVDMNRAVELVKYHDERKIVEKAIREINKRSHC